MENLRQECKLEVDRLQYSGNCSTNNMNNESELQASESLQAFSNATLIL